MDVVVVWCVVCVRLRCDLLREKIHRSACQAPKLCRQKGAPVASPARTRLKTG